MRLYRTASIESYMPDDILKEYRGAKEYYDWIIDQWLDHIDKKDEGDIRWVNQNKEFENKVKEAFEEMKKIKEPYVARMEEGQKRRESQRDLAEKKTKEIFEKAKSDVRFQKGIIEAVKEWPRTNNFRLAGYIMPDGDMLAFSYDSSTRGIDHRYITQDIDELEDGTAGMRQFMYATGAVRLHSSDDFANFDWSVPLTYPQKEKIREIASVVDEIYADDMSGNSKEYGPSDRYKFLEEYKINA